MLKALISNGFHFEWWAKRSRSKGLHYLKRYAFTLSELLIALGVIGVLTAVLMPIIFSLAPNQNVLMAKRAFYTTETVISDMLNDPNCYPRINDRVGFDDGLGYAKCDKYGGKDNPSKLSVDNAKEKFVTLFADKLNLKGDITSEGDKYTFKTKDGMEWTLSNLNFKPAQADSYGIITVDVNPSSKSPNCGDGATTGKCEKSTNYDKFSMRILAKGKIQLLDCWAILATQVDKKLVGKDKITSENCKDYSVTEEKLEAERLAKRRQFDKWEVKIISSGISCTSIQQQYGIENCPSGDGDRFAAAVQECGGRDNIASEDDLWELAKTLYTNCDEDTKECTDFDSSKVPEGLSGLGSTWNNLWSSTEDGASYAYFRSFSSTRTFSAPTHRASVSPRVVCVGDL